MRWGAVGGGAVGGGALRRVAGGRTETSWRCIRRHTSSLSRHRRASPLTRPTPTSRSQLGVPTVPTARKSKLGARKSRASRHVGKFIPIYV